jgi:hypothetical protein
MTFLRNPYDVPPGSGISPAQASFLKAEQVG